MGIAAGAAGPHNFDTLCSYPNVVQPYCIEHVWDRIGRALQTIQIPSTTLEELEVAVTKEWNQVSPAYIRGLVESLPRRIPAAKR